MPSPPEYPEPFLEAELEKFPHKAPPLTNHYVFARCDGTQSYPLSIFGASIDGVGGLGRELGNFQQTPKFQGQLKAPVQFPVVVRVTWSAEEKAHGKS